MNRRAKGIRKRRKIQRWLEEDGWMVIVLERSERYGPKDLEGADLLAIKDGATRPVVVAIQCKSNRGDISRGKKELADGNWPGWVDRWVVCWEDYKKSPLTYVLEARRGNS